uniref:Integrase zinc-binding domain-containing protein n=1 Tax=Chenopodium quinoa TaxID=63459 RepID=A0A803N145_CHEQI
MEITAEDNWKTPILKYLKDGVLPSDPLKARKIRYKESRYTILHNVLYKVSSTGLLQRCLVGDERWEMLQEHHDGECGSHAGARGLATKLLRIGYFWPT